MTFVSLLATFDIRVAQDDNGNDVVPSGKVKSGVVA